MYRNSWGTLIRKGGGGIEENCSKDGEERWKEREADWWMKHSKVLPKKLAGTQTVQDLSIVPPLHPIFEARGLFLCYATLRWHIRCPNIFSASPHGKELPLSLAFIHLQVYYNLLPLSEMIAAVPNSSSPTFQVDLPPSLSKSSQFEVVLTFYSLSLKLY